MCALKELFWLVPLRYAVYLFLASCFHFSSMLDITLGNSMNSTPLIWALEPPIVLLLDWEPTFSRCRLRWWSMHVCIYWYRLFCAVTPSAIRKITKGDFYCITMIMNKFQTSVPMTIWNNDKIKREKERRKTAIYLKGHSQPTHDPIEKFNFLMILNIGFILCSLHRLECGIIDKACA